MYVWLSIGLPPLVAAPIKMPSRSVTVLKLVIGEWFVFHLTP